MKIKQTTNKNIDIPIDLLSDNFISYHRVAKMSLPICTGDTLTVSIAQSCVLESWKGLTNLFSKTIEKSGSTGGIDLTENYIISEIHIKLCERGKNKGLFNVYWITDQDKKIDLKKFIELKETK
jgi:hypothetical protein